jgi:hypothetical protein
MSDIQLKSNAEWAALYSQAIQELLQTGQSYSIAGRSFTFADLGILQKAYDHFYRLCQDEGYGDTDTVDVSRGFRH